VYRAIVARKSLAIIAALVLGVGVASCASAPSINAAIVVGSDVNPDARGRPSPIVVKLFELKSLAAFETADFFSLFEKDKETLGAELLGRDEFSLIPGDRKVVVRELKEDARYVGVIAAYRDLERANWRAAFPVPPKKKTSVIVQLESRKISIVPQ
jgi:type VI secretion system protein VasD